MLATKTVIAWSAPENEAILTKMADQGMKVADIAEVIGVHKSSVNLGLKKHWPHIHERVASFYSCPDYVKIIKALKIATNKTELAGMTGINPSTLRKFLIDNYPQHVDRFYNTRKAANIRMLKGALADGKIHVIAEKLGIPESSVISGRSKYGHLTTKEKKAKLAELENKK